MQPSAFFIDTLAIGDELLCGRISDTNSSYVAKRLMGLGLRLRRTTVIEDQIPTIQSALRELSQATRICVCFGGLGPTSDDMTAEAVAGLLAVPIVECPETVARIETFCQERGRTVTPQILKQARYPQGTRRISNRVGLAVGFSVDFQGCVFFFLPGVPEEMKSMFEEQVLPEISQRALGTDQALHFKKWRLLGIPESELQRHMDPIEAALPPGLWLGYQTRYPENHLLLYAKGPRSTPPAEVLGEWPEKISGIVKPWCYSDEDLELEEAVLRELERRGQRLVAVESCTGGGIAHRLTDVAGSSRSFWGALVTYQVDAKNRILGVDLAPDSDGVGEKLTGELAERALERSGCDVAIAVTGFMGPSGGTAQDPVGTFYWSVAAKGGPAEVHRVPMFDRGRSRNQGAATTFVLDGLRKFLQRK